MSLVDLPLDELRVFRPPLQLPVGFDDFWDRTLAELATHGLAVRRTPEPVPLTTVAVDDVRFAGWGGHEVAAWLLRPTGDGREPVAGPLPCVVEFIGYSGGRGLPHERLLWSAAGYAHLVVDTRGQGWGGTTGVTADPGYDGSPAGPGLLTRGLHDPHAHYYRRVYADAVRAVEVARSLPEVDPTQVVVHGRSQGGGIALAVSGLVDGLLGVMADVPFLCAFRRAVDVTDADPYGEVVRWLAGHRDDVEQAFDTLDHVDAVHLAARAGAPALLSVALRDEVCPPSTVFSAFNHYGEHPRDHHAPDPAVDKEVRVWWGNGHEGGGAHQERDQLAWLGARVRRAAGGSAGRAADRTEGRTPDGSADGVRRAPAGPEDPPAASDDLLNPA